MRRVLFMITLVSACFSDPVLEAVGNGTESSGLTSWPLTSGQQATTRGTMTATSSATAGSDDDAVTATGPDSATTKTQSTGSEGGSTGSEGSGTAGACSCGDAIQSAWQGPYFVYNGTPEQPAACPPGQVPQVEGGLNLIAPPAECSCTCAPDDVACELDDTLAVDLTLGPSCSLHVGDAEATVDECLDFDTLPAVALEPQGFNAPLAGTCTLTDATESVQPPVFQTQGIVCAPSEPNELCDDAGECATSDAVRICITRTGEHACHDARFPQRYVAATEVVDTRSCSPCACAETPSGHCQQRVAFYGDDDCDPSELQMTASAPGEYCAGQARSLRYFWESSPTSCSHAGGTPQGSAQGAGLITLCCAQ